ncbi:hypothetical protein NliqN6_1872 [Naganishia liquefaciens]|uniref:Uncharacterized protein n=1 Tax=Naganishia liquefaciens TaxID=104408 RepID=A0A8H3TRU9_9TREE|nr:hypothetical protein NliqN6_1872 [Naganishia liquefaciens]
MFSIKISELLFRAADQSDCCTFELERSIHASHSLILVVDETVCELANAALPGRPSRMTVSQRSLCSKKPSADVMLPKGPSNRARLMERDDLEEELQALPNENVGATSSTASTTVIPDIRPTVIDAPAQIGLIMPNPRSNVYTGVEYRMGYVDPGPAPRVIGALRMITPLLNFSNRTVGSLDADPAHFLGSLDWCSVNLAAAPYTFPFKFETSGWHQFVINTTWGRPTITGDDPTTNCSDPITAQYTFFGTQAVSVAPSPTTGGLIKAAPAFTVWVDLTWRTPGPLLLEHQTDTPAKVGYSGIHC